MDGFSEKSAAERAASLLGQWILGEGAQTELDTRSSLGVDDRLRVGDHEFLLEFKARPTADALESAASQLQRKEPGSAVPIVVVPFMSDLGKERCRQTQLSWLDLSGNADIRAPGLRLVIEGKPNRFKRPGRVSSAFAPKGARVARHLLQNAGGSSSQAEIADATRLSAGHVSKVLTKLLQERLVARTKEGLVTVPDPDQLLDAWAREYDLSKHRRVSAILATRTGQQTTATVAARLAQQGVPHAATGLSAAALIEPFAQFRTASLFVDAPVDDSLLSALGVRPAERGGNLWLVEPNDQGVFDGASERDGVRCCHPVQVYLDLLGHPERAKEAAEFLRKHALNWSDNAS